MYNVMLLGRKKKPFKLLFISHYKFRELIFYNTNALIITHTDSSVVRTPAAQAEGRGFNPWWLPWFFFPLPAGLLM